MTECNITTNGCQPNVDRCDVECSSDPDETALKQLYNTDISNNAAAAHNENDSTGRHSITQPLLAYMVYALQSATAEHVRIVVTGHFTVADITEAKQTLWSHCGGDVIGTEMPRRRDSSARSIEEAHVHGHEQTRQCRPAAGPHGRRLQPRQTTTVAPRGD